MHKKTKKSLNKNNKTKLTTKNNIWKKKLNMKLSLNAIWMQKKKLKQKHQNKNQIMKPKKQNKKYQ